MDTYPLVSLILLNHNGLTFLGKFFGDCLESILNTDYPNFEIVFVDNGSTDESVSFFEGLVKTTKLSSNPKSIKVVKCTRNIIAEGYNEGMRASKGKLLALLSNDMIYKSDWLALIVKTMEQDLQIGVAGCKRLVYDYPYIIDGLGGNINIDGRPSIPGRFEIDRGQYHSIMSMDWIGGAAVIRKSVLKITGLFDTEYYLFYEDADLCYRTRKSGYTVMCIPRAILWHKTTTTISKAFSKQLTHYFAERSRIRFALIHFVKRRILATLLIDLIHVIGNRSSSKLMLIKAYYWNLRHLPFTLKKRLLIGPSPPYGCKYPVLPFSFQDLKRRLKKRV